MILDGAGGECTFMWHSYHQLGVTDLGVPVKFLIGKVRDYEDFYSYSGDFYRDIKISAEKIIPKGKRNSDWKLYVKSFFVLVGYLYSLYFYCTECTILSAMLMGFFAG